MNKTAILAAAAGLVVGGLTTATVAEAQRDNFNPLENFLRGIETRQGSANLSCNVQHRLDRRGDIRWIQVICDRRR